MLLEEIKSWNKLANETDEAYSAFCLYLNLGKRRSLATLITTIDKPLSIEQLNSWSNMYSWSKRVEQCERFIQDELLNNGMHLSSHVVTLHKMEVPTNTSYIAKRPQAKYLNLKGKAKRPAH
jgi:hypothetical protein